MKDGRHNLPDAVDPRLLEIQSPEGGRDVFVISAVVDGVDFGHASLAQEVVRGRVAFQLQFPGFAVRRAKKQLKDPHPNDKRRQLAGPGESVIVIAKPQTHLIKRVEVPLARLLNNHARLFQQIVVDVAADGIAFEIEMNIHVLSKTGRIVVPVRLGVAERLQNGVRLEQNVLHAGPKQIK